MTDAMKEERPGLVVIGGGAAGLNAALTCREQYPDVPVTLVDGEGEIGYYRTLTPMFTTGQMPEEKLFFWRPGEDALLQAHLGVTVSSLDRNACRVTLSDGRELPYERLILACGGRPIVPPVFENRDWPKGVFAVRSLATARRIKAWLPDHRRIAVLGGGLVGTKSSIFLALAGFQVVLVERESHILPTVLSDASARPIEKRLKELGVDVHTKATIDDIRQAEGAVRGVHVSGGGWIDCDTFLIGVGSTPDIDFLAGTGLIDEAGELAVSTTLQTLDPRIFAVGDAVTIKTADGQRHYPWTWPQAQKQGRVAGANAFRPWPVPVPRVTRVNAQNLSGVPIMILGGPGVGSSTISRPGTGDVWREFFMEEGRIVGGALVGDIAGAGPLHAAMVRGDDVGGNEADLLKTRTTAFSKGAFHRLAQTRRARHLVKEEIKA